MKCIIVSDIHLGISNNNQIWLDQTKKLFEHIIDECVKRDIYTVCILGDFFHDRKNLYMKTIETAIYIVNILKQSNIQVKIILGNHDVFYKTENTINSLHIFNEYNNIEIIEKSTIIDGVGFIPWNCDLNIDTDVIFGHFEINGFSLGNGRVFEKGEYKISDFSKYKMVLTGHFHTPSKISNIQYLGSPYQLTFNDVGSKRGFYVFDNGELEFIEFQCIEFVYITTEEEPDPLKIKGNIVRLIFEKDYGTTENDKKIQNIQMYDPLLFYTDFSKISNEITVDDTEQTSIHDIKTNREILNEFINIGKHPENIEVNKMMKIIDALFDDK